MTFCDFTITETGGRFHYDCKACGDHRETTHGLKFVKMCRGAGLADPPKNKSKKGLWGDLLAAKLDSLGITKERWTDGLVALNLTTYEEGCGCADRQAKLNEIGDRIMGWLGRKAT